MQGPCSQQRIQWPGYMAISGSRCRGALHLLLAQLEQQHHDKNATARLLLNCKIAMGAAANKINCSPMAGSRCISTVMAYTTMSLHSSARYLFVTGCVVAEQIARSTGSAVNWPLYLHKRRIRKETQRIEVTFTNCTGHK